MANFLTVMHLADAFIQSDLHCISMNTFTFLSILAFPGNRTHDNGVARANGLLFEIQESYISADHSQISTHLLST